MKTQCKHIDEVCYEIRVEGQLNPCLSDWFDGLAIENLESGETAISGRVADQAALHGLLAKIRDMNLKLISVRRKDMAESYCTSAAPGRAAPP